MYHRSENEWGDDNGRPVGISDIDSTQLKIADFTDYRQEKIEQQLEKMLYTAGKNMKHADGVDDVMDEFEED